MFVAAVLDGPRRWLQWSAQRMTEFRPSTQMRTQSSAARMITMLASKLALLPAAGDVRVPPAPAAAAAADAGVTSGVASLASLSRRMVHVRTSELS